MSVNTIFEEVHSARNLALVAYTKLYSIVLNTWNLDMQVKEDIFKVLDYLADVDHLLALALGSEEKMKGEQK